MELPSYSQELFSLDSEREYSVYVWISLREQGFVGAALSQGWHRAGNRRGTNVPKEEKKSREEKLELNVVMSAREGKKIE